MSYTIVVACALIGAFRSVEHAALNVFRGTANLSQVVANDDDETKKDESAEATNNQKLSPLLETKIDVYYTDSAFGDLIKFMSEYKSIPFIVLNEEIAKSKVTLAVENDALRKVLDLACPQINAKWIPAHNTVFIGAEKEIDALKTRLKEHDKRHKKLDEAAATDANAKGLVEIPKPETKDKMSLEKILEFAKVSADLPNEVKEKTESLAIGDDPLDWIIERALIPLGYTWQYADGKITFSKAK